MLSGYLRTTESLLSGLVPRECMNEVDQTLLPLVLAARDDSFTFSFSCAGVSTDRVLEQP